MEADDPPPVTDVQAALLNQAEELRKKRDAERAFLSRRELKKARKKLSNLYRRAQRTNNSQAAPTAAGNHDTEEHVPQNGAEPASSVLGEAGTADQLLGPSASTLAGTGTAATTTGLSGVSGQDVGSAGARHTTSALRHIDRDDQQHEGVAQPNHKRRRTGDKQRDQHASGTSAAPGQGDAPAQAVHEAQPVTDAGAVQGVAGSTVPRGPPWVLRPAAAAGGATAAGSGMAGRVDMSQVLRLVQAQLPPAESAATCDASAATANTNTTAADTQTPRAGATKSGLPFPKQPRLAQEADQNQAAQVRGVRQQHRSQLHAGGHGGGAHHRGPGKRPAKQYLYGNYHGYYGYRHTSSTFDDDPRLALLKEEWFARRHMLDVGCNEGLVTLAVATRFGCATTTGVDIDEALVQKAARNLRNMRTQLTSQLHAMKAASHERQGQQHHHHRHQQASQTLSQGGSIDQNPSSSVRMPVPNKADPGPAAPQRVQVPAPQQQQAVQDNAQVQKPAPVPTTRPPGDPPAGQQPAPAQALVAATGPIDQQEKCTDMTTSPAPAVVATQNAGQDHQGFKAQPQEDSQKQGHTVSGPSGASSLVPSSLLTSRPWAHVKGALRALGAAQFLVSDWANQGLDAYYAYTGSAPGGEGPEEGEGGVTEEQGLDEGQPAGLAEEGAAGGGAGEQRAAEGVGKDGAPAGGDTPAASAAVAGQRGDDDGARDDMQAQLTEGQQPGQVIQPLAPVRRLPKRFGVIMCLSVTKWVHLNWGDDGLMRLFRRFWDSLEPGGHLVLEPQPWRSYKAATHKRSTLDNSFRELSSLQLRPDDFTAILTQELGFIFLCDLNEGSTAQGFDRPMCIYQKPGGRRSSLPRPLPAPSHGATPQTSSGKQQRQKQKQKQRQRGAALQGGPPSDAAGPSEAQGTTHAGPAGSAATPGVVSGPAGSLPRTTGSAGSSAGGVPSSRKRRHRHRQGAAPSGGEHPPT